MKITPITVAVNHLRHKASDLAHEVRKKAGRAAIELAGRKSAPGFFRDMVLEKIHNRWSGVREQFQLSASQSRKPPVTDQLVLKAYKATIDEWSVRDPGQPLCGPELTLEVNRKLLTFLNNCPANTRIAIGKLLSKDAVHARAMEDTKDAISAGRYASTDMLRKAVEKIVEKAPPSNAVNVSYAALVEDIVARLRLSPAMEAELMANLIQPLQDRCATDEGSFRGSSIDSLRGSNSSELPAPPSRESITSSELPPIPSRGSITSSRSSTSYRNLPAPPSRGSIASSESSTSYRDLPAPPSRGSIASSESSTSYRDLPAPPSRGSIASSESSISYWDLPAPSPRGSITSSQLSITPDFISNEDGDAGAPASPGAPTKEWVNEWVNYIKQRIMMDGPDHRAHTARIKQEAEDLELHVGVPFSEAISAIREVFRAEFKDQSQPVPEHAKQVLNDAIYWHRKEAEAFRNAIFNGKNPALKDKINALPMVAAMPGDADDVIREELKQIVRDVQSLPGIQPTRAAANDDVARLQIAKIYRDRDSLQDKATGALLEKIRLEMMQQTTGP